jgi:hypothetical protein
MSKHKTRHCNQRIPTLCSSCAKPNGGLVKRSKAANPAFLYTDLCPECKERIKDLAGTLADGGVLVLCTCGAVTAVAKVPAGLEEKVAMMPNGTRFLKLQGCPLCKKEDPDGTGPADPDLHSDRNDAPR